MSSLGGVGRLVIQAWWLLQNFEKGWIMNEMQKPSLVVVDDERGIACFIQEVAENLGFKASWELSGKTFIKKWGANGPDVIVLDLVMPDIDGIEVIQQLADSKWSGAVVLMSGYNGTYLKVAKTLATAKGLHLVGVLIKPFQTDQLESMLQALRN